MKISLFVMFLIFMAPVVLAASNESIEASGLINQAKEDLMEMQEREILTNRANESYQEALQLYDAQMALERLHRNARFNLIIEYTTNVAEIKEMAFKAQDELNVFVKVFDSANKSMNISSIFDDYNTVVLSFEEERFEDTIKLIEAGYITLSEIQSSQTTINLFYSSTTKTLKNFFKTQWKTLTFVTIGILLFFFLFWNALSRFKIHINLQNLIIQKKSIRGLIKKLQSDYFIHQNISASAYNIRLKKFESMILDIDRQIPLLREDIIKLNGKGRAMVYLAGDKVKKTGKKNEIKKVKKVKKRKVTLNDWKDVSVIKKEIRKMKKSLASKKK